MTQHNKLFLLNIQHFEKYCIDFCHIEYGIYPIATTKEIKNAIKVFLLLNDLSTIEFDTIDREKVRKILNK